MENADCMVERTMQSAFVFGILRHLRPTASAAPADSPPDCLLDGASAQGALASYAKAPIGSHAGSMVAGSSRADWYSSGSMAFGTATS